MTELPPHIQEKVQHALPSDLIHDLRTPLGHILGYAELLKEQAEEAGDSQYQPFIHKIQFAAEQLLGMLNENFRATKRT